MPENAVRVCRPTKWGNSFKVEQYGREQAVYLFRQYIGHPNTPHGFDFEDIEQLRGKNLACWCPLPEPGQPDICHAAVLLEIANAPQEAA